MSHEYRVTFKKSGFAPSIRGFLDHQTRAPIRWRTPRTRGHNCSRCVLNTTPRAIIEFRFRGRQQNTNVRRHVAGGGEGQRERRVSERTWVVFMARFWASNIYIFLPILLLAAPWKNAGFFPVYFYTFCTGHFQIFSSERSEKSHRFSVYSDRNNSEPEIPRRIRLQWNFDNSNVKKYNFRWLKGISRSLRFDIGFVG